MRIIWIPSSILTSDEEPPLDRGGGTERPRRRVMAAYAATPSHEKTYPSAAPPGTSRINSSPTMEPMNAFLSFKNICYLRSYPLCRVSLPSDTPAKSVLEPSETNLAVTVTKNAAEQQLLVTQFVGNGPCQCPLVVFGARPSMFFYSRRCDLSAY